MDIGKILESAIEEFAAFGLADDARDLDWWAFPQTWGNTTGGHGGIGGQAMTGSQTIVVVADQYTGGPAAVYFGGRFAYLVPKTGERFWDTLHNWDIPGKGDYRGRKALELPRVARKLPAE